MNLFIKINSHYKYFFPKNTKTKMSTFLFNDIHDDELYESLFSNNYYITEKQLDNILLNENRGSKNLSKARSYIAQQAPNQNPDDVINQFRHDIPNVRLPKIGEMDLNKFFLGVARLFFTGQLNTADKINRINEILYYISSKEYVDKYDENLNNQSFEQLNQDFTPIITNQTEKEKAELSTFTSRQSDYKIIKINNFDEAHQYSQYTSWCITKEEKYFNDYSSYGENAFYFCLKNGFENTPATKAENCPLDEYGLSMIAVSVLPDGKPNTITCRWNHDNGGNDSVMTPTQLSHIIGKNFYQTFIPNEFSVDEFIKKNFITQQIRNEQGELSYYTVHCFPNKKYGYCLVAKGDGSDFAFYAPMRRIIEKDITHILDNGIDLFTIMNNSDIDLVIEQEFDDVAVYAYENNVKVYFKNGYSNLLNLEDEEFVFENNPAVITYPYDNPEILFVKEKFGDTSYLVCNRNGEQLIPCKIEDYRYYNNRILIFEVPNAIKKFYDIYDGQLLSSLECDEYYNYNGDGYRLLETYINGEYRVFLESKEIQIPRQLLPFTFSESPGETEIDNELGVLLRKSNSNEYFFFSLQHMGKIYTVQNNHLVPFQETVNESKSNNTTSNYYTINPNQVLIVKKFLDNHFIKASIQDKEQNTKPIITLVDNNKKHIKNFTPQQLFYLLQYRFKHLTSNKNKRDKLLKQIIIDWYNSKISKQGLLSTNKI